MTCAWCSAGVAHDSPMSGVLVVETDRYKMVRDVAALSRSLNGSMLNRVPSTASLPGRRDLGAHPWSGRDLHSPDPMGDPRSCRVAILEWRRCRKEARWC